MSPRESLVAVLERRKARSSAAEHRLARERTTLDQALTALRTGEDAGVVLARLRAKGLAISASAVGGGA